MEKAATEAVNSPERVDIEKKGRRRPTIILEEGNSDEVEDP